MIRRFLHWLLLGDIDNDLQAQIEDYGTDGPPEHWLPLVSGKDEWVP
jgi:hypothetical protein